MIQLMSRIFTWILSIFRLLDTTKDLTAYKELLIKNNNAEEVFLNYEQENSNDNAGTHFTDYIKPFRFKTSVE